MSRSEIRTEKWSLGRVTWSICDFSENGLNETIMEGGQPE